MIDNGDLCAGSDRHQSEPGLVVASAGSDNVGTVPGYRFVVDTETPSWPKTTPPKLSRRQRKRKRDVSRKKLFSEAFDLRGLINMREKENESMEEELMTLRAQKALLSRKLNCTRTKVTELNKKVDVINQKAISSSYGLRLLQTASGQRIKSHSRASSEIFDVTSLPTIDPAVLCCKSSTVLGVGRFGECTTAKLHEYVVCIKKLRDDTVLLREAHFLHKIGGHKNLPFLFGVVKSENFLVMSCHTINNQAVTIYNALNNANCDSSELIQPTWVKYIIMAIQTVSYLHDANILHNDIKGDNFVLGMTSANEAEPFLLDFGKARYANEGKCYKLSNEEKSIYKKEHCHVAPDLRDGITFQSKASDIYALGQLMYYIYKKVNLMKTIKVVIKMCLAYNDFERPSCSDIQHLLSNKDYLTCVLW